MKYHIKTQLHDERITAYIHTYLRTYFDRPSVHSEGLLGSSFSSRIPFSINWPGSGRLRILFSKLSASMFFSSSLAFACSAGATSLRAEEGRIFSIYFFASQTKKRVSDGGRYKHILSTSSSRSGRCSRCLRKLSEV